MVIIDTCAWINYLRGAEQGLALRVQALIKSDEAAMTSVTITELLRGARSKRELQSLELLFSHVPVEPVLPVDWQSAGHELRQLAAKGVHGSTTDALIVAVARRLGLPVLTRDAQFADYEVKLA